MKLTSLIKEFVDNKEPNFNDLVPINDYYIYTEYIKKDNPNIIYLANKNNIILSYDKSKGEEVDMYKNGKYITIINSNEGYNRIYDAVNYKYLTTIPFGYEIESIVMDSTIKEVCEVYFKNNTFILVKKDSFYKGIGELLEIKGHKVFGGDLKYDVKHDVYSLFIGNDEVYFKNPFEDESENINESLNKMKKLIGF